MVLTPEELALAMLILAGAYFVKGVTSFGAALVSVPLLGLYLPPQLFIPMLALLNLATNGALLLRFWRSADLPVVGWLVLGAAIGTPGGVYLLNVLSPETLQVVIGIVVVASVPAIFWIRTLTPQQGVAPRWAIVAGLVSGICGGAVGIDGPPVVAYVALTPGSKATRYATLLAYFFVGAVIRTAGYLPTGLLGSEGALFTAWMLPAVGVGLLVGTRIYLRLDERSFDRAMAIVLLLTGIALVARVALG